MQRLTAILLCACFTLMGVGALKHLHNQAHVQAEATAAALSGAGERVPADRDAPPPLRHERDCPLHAMLQGALLAPSPADALALDATAVATARVHAAEPAGCRLPARVDCRGPPNC